MQRSPVRILVVGQTPPPFGGQAVMIEHLLAGRFDRIKLFHVRMAFSDDMESVGKFAVKKVWILFATVLRIWWSRMWHRTPVLYYPPSGPNKIPVLRDIILLCCTRWLFAKVVFHFHAGGVSSYAPQLPAPLRPLFRWAYRRPTLAIRTAPQNPEDGIALGAHRNVIIPNGIEDHRGTVPERTARASGPITILFTGVLIPSKGVGVLLEAFERVIAKGVDARLEVMGKWGDQTYAAECKAFVERHGLTDRVQFLGVKMDREKFEHFAACDIFCFPSYFEAESFGLVLVEAMQFAKPVISTDWRGIPSVVSDGVNGTLVPIKDPDAVADALVRLALDPDLRASMGNEGRCIFERNFTLEAFHRSMEQALAGLYEQH
ncbi:MAG: glycosyltransferase family 4 protein [Flavobacteriales bacterium]|nr:glycosyltransferase family 4 protein [Flavobacteriales bacterium]